MELRVLFVDVPACTYQEESVQDDKDDIEIISADDRREEAIKHLSRTHGDFSVLFYPVRKDDEGMSLFYET